VRPSISSETKKKKAKALNRPIFSAGDDIFLKGTNQREEKKNPEWLINCANVKGQEKMLCTMS